jgi:hypothetical protein
MKAKKEVDHDFPIRVNMIKFLAEERRQVIIDFAKAKLHASQQDLDHRIFAFIVNREENISQYVVGKSGPLDKLLYPSKSPHPSYPSSLHLACDPARLPIHGGQVPAGQGPLGVPEASLQGFDGPIPSEDLSGPQDAGGRVPGQLVRRPGGLLGADAAEDSRGDHGEGAWQGPTRTQSQGVPRGEGHYQHVPAAGQRCTAIDQLAFVRRLRVAAGGAGKAAGEYNALWTEPLDLEEEADL